MLRSLLLGLSLAAGVAFAQQPPVAPKHDDPPPAATQPGTGGIQGQNILDVKPEVKPDASSDPKYMQQNNAQRNAVQPGNNSPLWREAVKGVEGFTSYPKETFPEAGVLIQGPVQYPGSRFTTAGEAWRQVRNNWLIPYGGALLLIVLGALALFYFARGPIGHHGVEEGTRKIERFTPFERSTHWATAISFSILAISGIVMAFGKFFMLPVMGKQLFGPLTWILKTMHNFAGPVFAVAIVIMFVTFVRDNWPQRGDLNWLLKGGGLFGKNAEEPPSHRFNAGEKLIFWGGVLVLGFFVVSSGLVLDKLFPGINYDRMGMQYAHMIHLASSTIMMCVFAAHIYLGSIGMKGSYTAMRHGWVGDEWAKEHHAYWYDDIAAGKIPAQRSKPPQSPVPEAEQARPA